MIFTKPVNITTVNIRRTGNHHTLVLELQNDDIGSAITHCKCGTPAAKVSKWQQILKGAVLYSVNDTEIHTDVDVTRIIKEASGTFIKFCVIPPEPTNIHPETCLPQLNFDQFIHLASVSPMILMLN